MHYKDRVLQGFNSGVRVQSYTHLLLGIGSRAPNTVISCILLALYFTLQDQA